MQRVKQTISPLLRQDAARTAQQAVRYYRAFKAEDEYEGVLRILKQLHQKWRDRLQRFRKFEGEDDDLSGQIIQERQQMRELRRLAESLDDDAMLNDVTLIEDVSEVVQKEISDIDPMQDIDTLTGPWDVKPYGAPPARKRPRKKRGAAAAWSREDRGSVKDDEQIVKNINKIEQVLERAIARTSKQANDARRYRNIYKSMVIDRGQR